MTIKPILILLALFGLITNILSADPQETIVVQWNKVLLQAVVNSNFPPTPTYRALALVHASMFNAWAAYDSKAIPIEVSNFSRQPISKRTFANKHAAISYAAYYALKELIPAQQSLYDQLMQSHGYPTDKVPTDPSTAAGVGTLAAQNLLNIRHNDGSNQLGDLNPSHAPYSEPVLLPGYKPYVYVNTVDQLNDINYWQPLPNPDGTAQRFLTPHWRIVKPFALKSGDQYRPVKGPVTTDENYDKFLAQHVEIYEISKALTPKQKVIADFWKFAGPVNPNPWSRVAQDISKRDKNSLDDDVKLFFGMAVASSDAMIAVFDVKIAFNSVRPITVIKNRIDPTWQTLNPTPPFPDFNAGHSAISEAVRAVLKGLTGSDYYGGSYTDTATGINLSWKTFGDAANEAGRSTMYGGIHTGIAVSNGHELGKQVGKTVWKKIKDLIDGNAGEGEKDGGC